MSTQKDLSKANIVIISQWPDVKNAEYELIEKIRDVACNIVVVDSFGFNIDDGCLLNDSEMYKKYDFAIALHHHTQKLLNLPTYLWVANPLQYMYSSECYRNQTTVNIRTYDSFLFNGSETLQNHITLVASEEHLLQDDLRMYPSSSLSSMSKANSNDSNKNNFLFYCGINWEATCDVNGRAESLLKSLDGYNRCNFFGPTEFLGHNTWDGYNSYKGEIPFDGHSLISEISNHLAVLAVSSPAHLKSATSSSRVFEAIAASVPVISDKNPHVINLFGDSIYYFDGETDIEKSESIIEHLIDIEMNPEGARERVSKARKLMFSKYCFDNCFTEALGINEQQIAFCKDIICKNEKVVIKLDVFVFPHFHGIPCCGELDNINHIISAINYISTILVVEVNLFIVTSHKQEIINIDYKNINIIFINDEWKTAKDWHAKTLGDKFKSLISLSKGDYSCFFTQYDYPQYDYFSKSLRWLEDKKHNNGCDIYLAGWYESQLKLSKKEGANEVDVFSLPYSKYKWTNDSLSEHQLSSFIFSKNSIEKLTFPLVNFFDVALPLYIILMSIRNNVNVHRSPYILMRAYMSNYSEHYKEYLQSSVDGAWSQNYNLLTNYKQEMNALYDICGDSKKLVDIIDNVREKFISKESNRNSYMEIVEEILRGRLNNIIIYGAGVLGIKFLSLCKIHAPNLSINFVDARASVNEFYANDVKVNSPAKLKSNFKDTDGIVIASDTFYKEIHSYISMLDMSELILN